MTKQHRIVHSSDATTVIVEGDRRRPEPTYVIVKFPGGHVEVTRCDDGTYWAHIGRPDDRDNLVIHDSRIDYQFPLGTGQLAGPVNHIAVRIGTGEQPPLEQRTELAVILTPDSDGDLWPETGEPVTAESLFDYVRNELDADRVPARIQLAGRPR